MRFIKRIIAPDMFFIADRSTSPSRPSRPNSPPTSPTSRPTSPTNSTISTSLCSLIGLSRPNSPTGPNCSADSVEAAYEYLVPHILGDRNILVVSKGDGLLSLLSEDVSADDLCYIEKQNATVPLFTFTFDRGVVYYVSYVRSAPRTLIANLVGSIDFLFGNMWFCVADPRLTQSNAEGDIAGIVANSVSSYRGQQVLMEDIYKLAVHFPAKSPRHEIVTLPAVSDGLCLRWFNYEDWVYRRIFGHISSFCDGSATRVLQHGQMGSLLGSAGSLSSLGTLSVGSFVGASSFGFSAASGFRDSYIDSSGASTSRASGTVPSSSGPSVEPVSTPSTPISSSTPVSTPFTQQFSSIGTVVSSGVLGIAESSGTTRTFGATKNLKKLHASETCGSVETSGTSRSTGDRKSVV